MPTSAETDVDVARGGLRRSRMGTAVYHSEVSLAPEFVRLAAQQDDHYGFDASQHLA